MDETYREVLYDTKRWLYIQIDIDYSKIEGETLEEKINKVEEQCKKKGLFYCQRGKSDDEFILPRCEAILPRHTKMIKLISSDDFYDFINNRNEKNLNNLWFRSDDEIKNMFKNPSVDTLKTENLNQKNNKGYLSRAEKKKLKKNILV
jgi:hypothetical protein